MKKSIIAIAALAATSLQAQQFVAGWDFDNAAGNATSIFANWGDSTATLSWTHALAQPPFQAQEFAISGSFDQPIVGNTFTFLENDLDGNTSFGAFSANDLPSTAKQGINFSGAGDVTFAFDASTYENLELIYVVDGQQTGLDLSQFNGVADVSFTLSGVANQEWDNVAVVGTTIVPEPSTYAAIAGALALGFVAYRRRK